jgi:hypothetical protein
MTTDALPRTDSRGLHIVLWIVQGLLFIGFGMAGLLKIGSPLDQLAQKMTWVSALPPWVVRFIGLSELAGALGMVLPSLTRIRPGLTALAGVGLAVVMVLAAALHVSRGELNLLPINFVLGGLAAFVAWGRRRMQPIAPRM